MKYHWVVLPANVEHNDENRGAHSVGLHWQTSVTKAIPLLFNCVTTATIVSHTGLVVTCYIDHNIMQ